eukprot:UN18707
MIEMVSRIFASKSVRQPFFEALTKDWSIFRKLIGTLLVPMGELVSPSVHCECSFCNLGST